MSESGQSGSRLIKRYGNRKLYDMESKRYVSLEGLAELVREGRDLRIEDKTTGEDVTSEVLAKVIVTEQQKGRSDLSEGYLHEIIRRGGQLLGATVGHIEGSFEGLLEASLRRLPPLKDYRTQVDQLRNRLDQLEAVVERLEASAVSKPPAGPRGSIRVVAAKSRKPARKEK